MLETVPSRWIPVALWVAGAYVAADLVVQGLTLSVLHPPRTPLMSTVAAPSNAPKAQGEGGEGMAALLGQGLAAVKAPLAGAAPVQNGEPVPEPSASLTLLGTMVSPGVSVAYVLAGGQETIVHEGSKLDAFVVEEIRSHSIVLQCRGQHKTLLMPSLAHPDAPGPAGGGLLPPPPAPEPAAKGKAVVNRSEIQSAMASQESLMKSMRVLPIEKDGHPYGMRVVYLDNTNILSHMGVETGDVILSLNGKNMQNAEDAFNAYQTIAKEKHVTFRVERGGKPVPLEVDIR